MQKANIKRRSDWTGIKKACQYCNSNYWDVPNRRLKYCSFKCWKKAVYRRQKYICKNCQKEYLTTKSRNTKFCYKKCETKYKTGKKRLE